MSNPTIPHAAGGLPRAAAVMLLATVSSIVWYGLRDVLSGVVSPTIGAVGAMVIPALLASYFALGVSRRLDIDRRERTGWVFVGLALGAACVWSFVILLPHSTDARGAVPMVGASSQLL
ncbi:MAG: hypothetical protein JWM90_1133, partial [Thermoleophilia bacterium]|nr:hypothetical protein [Thermoleophilia bacterium]